MKGVVPVIAVIIVFIVVISLAGIAYTYLIYYYTASTSKAVQVKDSFCEKTAGTIIQNIGTQQIFVSTERGPMFEYEAGPNTVVLLHFNNDSSMWESNKTVYDWSGNNNNATCEFTNIFIEVDTGNDDAEEDVATGAVDRISSDLEMSHDGTVNQTIGMRFFPINIPAGATIINAYVQFTADETSSSAVTLFVQGEASDNATSFGTGAFDISSRPRTTASVSWTPPAWSIVDEKNIGQRTPDITQIIQEIIGRPGWSNGNAISLIITGGTNAKRTAEAKEDSTSNEPMLVIRFLNPSPNPFNCAFINQTGGKFSGARRFDGLDDGIEILDAPSLNSENWTLEAWFMVENQTTSDSGGVQTHQTIIEKVISDQSRLYELSMDQPTNNTKCKLDYKPPSGGVTSAIVTGPANSVQFGRYYYVACTYNNQTKEFKLYQNGKLLDSTTLPAKSYLPGSPGNISIGKGSIDTRFRDDTLGGYVDEIRISNKALSENELFRNWAYTCTKAGDIYMCGDLTITKLSGGNLERSGFDKGVLNPLETSTLMDAACNGMCEYKILSPSNSIRAFVAC